MASALISTLIMVAIAAIIGGFIRYKIWGNANKPTTPIQYGRSWAAYMAFVVPISSIHLFIRKDLLNASIDFLISLIAFPALAFICGYSYGFFKINKPLLRNKIYLLAVFLTIILCIGFVTNKFLLTKNEKWIPLAKLPHVEFSQTAGTYTQLGNEVIYIDINSIRNADDYITATMGDELSQANQMGIRFIKSEIQVDCSDKKFRRTSYHRYEKTIDENFGKLISKSENVQRDLAKFSTEQGIPYSGGWSRLEAELAEIAVNSRSTILEQYTYENSKLNVQLIKFICNKDY